MPDLGLGGAGEAARTLKLERFCGVDLTSGEVNADKSRSPNAVNIMPDEDGFPQKRPGWKCTAQYPGAVWAGHRYVNAEGGEELLIHAGTVLWRGQTRLYSGMANRPSAAVQLGGRLWIVDGQNYLYYDGSVCASVEAIATVPLITVGKAPNGAAGATSYRPVNLLTPRRTDSFLGTAADCRYTLSFNALGPGAVEVTKLDAKGVWRAVPPAAYTVDRAAGILSFSAPPGESPVEGEDNLRVSYETAASGAARVKACTAVILYGVKGALDRVFLGASPAEPNIDYYSEWNDPAYIGDTFYGVTGQGASPIVGYNVLGNRLVTVKRGEENGRNIFIREGKTDAGGFAAFELAAVVQGEGAISPRCFAALAGEPLYLSRRGVQAITAADALGERCAQGRSFYLDGGLLREEAPENAAALTFGRFYALAVNERLYLLDGRQKSYESKAPHSAYQFEGYVWEGVPALSLFLGEGERLCFGTADGRVCAFKRSGESPQYSDETRLPDARGDSGKRAVACWWATPLMELDLWGRLKTVTGVWVAGQPYTRSGGRIYYASDREHEKLAREYFSDVFDWNDLDFNRFTFNTLRRPVIAAAGARARKVKLFQVRVENSRMDEPFGIIAVQIDYRTGRRIRR